MKTIHLIVVGKNKDTLLCNWEKDYQKRLSSIKINIHELKHLDSKQKNDQQVIQKIKNLAGKSKPIVVLLDERGKDYDSKEFSKYIFNELENNAAIYFVIGGAEGHGQDMLSFTKKRLRLSTFTMTHRLARTIFIEQLYRAETLHLNHPYHK